MKKFFVLTIFLIFSCAFLFSLSKNTEDLSFIDVDTKQAEELINENLDNSDFILIDVRSPQEYNDGYIKNAININYYDSDFSEQLDKLDKDKTYLIYCRSGNRSRRALEKMQDLKFKKVYHLKNGYSSWVNR